MSCSDVVTEIYLMHMQMKIEKNGGPGKWGIHRSEIVCCLRTAGTSASERWQHNKQTTPPSKTGCYAIEELKTRCHKTLLLHIIYISYVVNTTCYLKGNIFEYVLIHRDFEEKINSYALKDAWLDKRVHKYFFAHL